VTYLRIKIHEEYGYAKEENNVQNEYVQNLEEEDKRKLIYQDHLE